jgi:hypothetical protein
MVRVRVRVRSGVWAAHLFPPLEEGCRCDSALRLGGRIGAARLLPAVLVQVGRVALHHVCAVEHVQEAAVDAEALGPASARGTQAP